MYLFCDLSHILFSYFLSRGNGLFYLDVDCSFAWYIKEPRSDLGRGSMKQHVAVCSCSLSDVCSGKSQGVTCNFIKVIERKMTLVAPGNDFFSGISAVYLSTWKSCWVNIHFAQIHQQCATICSHFYVLGWEGAVSSFDLVIYTLIYWKIWSKRCNTQTISFHSILF